MKPNRMHVSSGLISIILLVFANLFFSFELKADKYQEALDKLLNSSSISKDKIGLVVIDLDRDKVIVSHRADASMIPASVMKAVTTATLANYADTDKPLVTKIYTVGNIKGGTLDGNILVIASGDPSVNSSKGPVSGDIVAEITRALKKKGITRITGTVIFDESVFSGPGVPSSWAAGDLNTYYGTALHGFNFEENASGKAAVKEPAGVFKTKLAKSLQGEGISLENGNIEPVNKRQLLVEHKSAILEDIMRSCMIRSDNLYAEAFQRLVAKEAGKSGSNENGAAEVMNFWRKNEAPMQGVTIVDGSGLSRSNRLTANFLSEVLFQMSEDPMYVSLFPLVGEEGTVKSFLKDTDMQGYMALKTGSMNGIQCYAGYTLDDDYVPTHVVVVMVNDLKNRAKFKEDLASFFLSIFKR